MFELQLFGWPSRADQAHASTAFPAGPFSGNRQVLCRLEILLFGTFLVCGLPSFYPGGIMCIFRTEVDVVSGEAQTWGARST